MEGGIAPRFVLVVGKRPIASVAAEGVPITNLRDCTVEVDDFGRLVLRLLDGPPRPVGAGGPTGSAGRG